MHPQPFNPFDRGSGVNTLAKLIPLPNQPKTPIRTLRVPDELWDAYGEVCEAEGTDRTKDIRGYMERRVRGAKQKARKGQQAEQPDDSEPGE